MTLLRMLAFRPEGSELGTDRPASNPAKKARAPSGAPNKGAPRVTPETAAHTSGNAAPDLHVVSSDVAPMPEATVEDWGALLAAADLRGAARQLADNCEIERSTPRRLELILSEEMTHLLTDQIRGRLQTELSRHLGRNLSLTVRPGRPPRPTPAAIRLANESERMKDARESVERDANIQAMQSAFDAVVEADSIRPIDE